MNKAIHQSILFIAISCILYAFFARESLAQSGAWHVKDAPVRYKVSVTGLPTHKKAGYIAKLPDGGILPRPFPWTIAVDEDGKELKHCCLWYDPDKALAVVFEAPAGSYVYVYAKKSEHLNIWKPESGLTPSMIIYVKRGTGMDAARQLAEKFPPGSGVYFGQIEEPSFGGDPLGRGGPCLNYILGYIASEDPGRTWIAPVGSVEIVIDGRKLNPVKESDKSCGTGQWFDISENLHKIETFHSFSGKGDEMRVAWRTPHTEISELGGKRPDNLRYAGTSMWAARPIRPDECVHSGVGKVVEIKDRDGSPVAGFSIRAQGFFNFGQKPLVLYTLRARTAGNPKDTQYAWSFEDSSEITGKVEAQWLLEAHMEHRVSLKAFSGDRHSRCTYSFYGFCNNKLKSDINSPVTKGIYRNAFLNMFEAFPLHKDPTATWSPGMWDLFFHLIEPGDRQALLVHIFTKRWDMLKDKISVEKRRQMEDIFFATISHMAPEKALKWLDNKEKEEKDFARRQHWKLMRVELYMYHLDKLDEARKLAGSMASVTSDLTTKAKIRLADIELLAGNHNKATKIYGEVQKKVKHSEQAAGKEKRRLSSGLARSKADLKQQRLARSVSWQRTGHRIADWRIGAIRDTAGSVTVRKLIDEGYLREAMKALDEWECEFPLSKLSGDYIVVEAKFYKKTGNYARARRILAAYCAAVDVTSYLPEAMREILSCMLEMKEPHEKIEEFCMEIRKRFPYHPVGDEAEEMLRPGGIERRE